MSDSNAVEAQSATVNSPGSAIDPALDPMSSEDEKKAVSTHVLVEEAQILKLRELSRRTRIAQSEYLREAVDDLLVKYVAESDAETSKVEAK